MQPAQQREAVLNKIRAKSRSHYVYEGLPQVQEGMPEGVSVDPKDVPGLRESGWNPAMQTTCVLLVCPVLDDWLATDVGSLAPFAPWGVVRSTR